MTKKKQINGLYRKFNVTRTDGTDRPGGKHHGCEYFVLDLTHDPFAVHAIASYIIACRDQYPSLAHDLEEKLVALSHLPKRKKVRK